jgi:beta-glucosidase
VVTPLAGLRSALSWADVRFDAGRDIPRAAALAAQADLVVVVVGCSARDEGEATATMDSATMRLLPPPWGSRVVADTLAGVLRGGAAVVGSRGGDRTRLTLHPRDEQLVEAAAAANARTVVVLVSGSAIVMEAWRERVPAILMAWYPGMEGGHALADVLAGAAEPGGRLPFAVPTDPAHLPPFEPGARRVRYDRWWGQRLLDRDGHAAAYPLGFGLGYTTFAVEDVRVTAVDHERLTARADVQVRNTGTRDGATVVQVYAAGDAGPDRPARQLLGFARVQAAAGATTLASVDLTLRPLARRDRASRTWSLVPASYVVEAGRFSGDPDAAVAPLPTSAG